MSHFHQFSFGLNVTPSLPPGSVVGVQQTPQPLAQLGLNALVEISTSSAFLSASNPPTRTTIAVMAHLDTGASLTSIDHSLAQHLQLISIGTHQIATPLGLQR